MITSGNGNHGFINGATYIDNVPEQFKILSNKFNK